MPPRVRVKKAVRAQVSSSFMLRNVKPSDSSLKSCRHRKVQRRLVSDMVSFDLWTMWHINYSYWDGRP